MDHFYQLPMLGAPEEPMLEAYTALGALAAATEDVLLGTLVTGNTYRNPTLLAKIITTLDVISQGRALLGIGTGWFELEHDQLGFEFGTFTDRFAKLDEALQILLPMISGERVSFDGRYYHTDQAIAVPRFRDHIPLMIGGSGEKKTFGLAARYFDHLNVIAAIPELPGKMDALARRCDEAGRDRSTLETSVLLTAVPDPNFTDDMVPEAMRGRMVVGSPERIAERLADGVVAAGVDGVILNVPRYVPGSVARLGAALRPVFGV
jgi:F420-dependent oxidoreductase-like protein